jgi:aminobenzoyl-glutamate transport protein
MNQQEEAGNQQQAPDSGRPGSAQPQGCLVSALNLLERMGNKLPDPAVLFLIGMLLTWVLSWWLSGMEFQELDPRYGRPIEVVNLLASEQLVRFLTGMVDEFAGFPPLGVVLVALLGVGIAEHSGFINACLKSMLSIAPTTLLTPMLLLAAVISNIVVDAGYVLVVPIGGIMFYVAGRHPLAGIAAAFAGVSGGFSANFIPSAIDPMLAKITQSGVELVAAGESVNPFCNIFFTAWSTLLIVLVGWFLTDVVVEPRLRGTALDGDADDMPRMEAMNRRDQIAMYCGLGVMLLGLVGLVAWVWPADSAMRAPDGSLTSSDPPVPLMESIVPLIFLAFLVPGVVYGYISGKFRSHRDVIKGMTRSMEAMGYYLVLVFFAALFIGAFRDSNIGVLIAVKGAESLQQAGASPTMTIVGIILLTACVNLMVGSASAKWAMLAPIFVPMLMLVGLSPELTQAAYRVGDSSTNIITPMMPYFPLVVVFCQRYVKKTGIGTLAAMMMPYSITFLVLWTVFLLTYWTLGLPLGLQAPYTYEQPMVPPG